MRIGLWCAAVAMACLSAGSAQGQINLYAEITETDISKPANSEWVRGDGTVYPKAMAMAGRMGCAVVAYQIDEDGNTRGVDIQSVSSNIIRRDAMEVVSRWQFTGGSEAEERVVRLDFCMTQESAELAEQMCAAQSRLACE